jgi:hypothetical protein
MKKILLGLIAGAILLTGTLIVFKPALADVIVRPVIGARVVVVDHRDGDFERHPELQAALRSLTEAERSLQRADGDFHGHKGHAITLVSKAITAVHQAIDTH